MKRTVATVIAVAAVAAFVCMNAAPFGAAFRFGVDDSSPVADDQAVSEPDFQLQTTAECSLDEDDYIPGQVMVSVGSGDIAWDDLGFSIDAVDQVLTRDDGSRVVKVTLSDVSQTDALIATLNTSSLGVQAQHNLRYEALEVEPLTTTTNDTYFNQSVQYGQYSLFTTNVVDAWDTVRAEHAVTVAVIDSGCRMDHADLVANLDAEHAWDLVEDAPLTGDDLGHGTHVAGIIAAAANNGKGIAGASYNAKVLPLNVFYPYGAGYSSDTEHLVAAYEYLDGLLDQGELPDLRVINMSLGGYNVDEVDLLLRNDIVAMQADHGILTVCAGGNGYDSGTPRTDFMTPGDFDACLSVTCLTSRGANMSRSDYNVYKDISAPGDSIVSTASTGANSYTHKTGTSMSAPLVSGIAALLFALDESMTPDMVREALEQTAHPVYDDVRTPQTTGSAGLVDAAAAVAYAQEHFLGEGATGSARAKAIQVVEACHDAGFIEDTDVALWLHDWLIDNCEHDADATSAADALCGGKGNALAYQAAYGLLLDVAGIKNCPVQGEGEDPCFWNGVLLDEVWYQVDAYCDDVPESYGLERHALYCVDDELMALFHVRATENISFNDCDEQYFIATGQVDQWLQNCAAALDENVAARVAHFQIAAPLQNCPAPYNDLVGMLAAHQLSGEPYILGFCRADFAATYSNGAIDVQATYAGTLSAGWNKVDGYWYYALNGVPVTGWQKIDNKWWYFDASGRMQSGLLDDGGKLYYLNNSMATGWQKVDGSWYYFNNAARTGWQKIDNKWWYFDASGRMQSGLLDDAGKLYYLNNSMVTGWQKLDGFWYYFANNARTGWAKVDGTWYFFDSEGRMQTGWLQQEKGWYYLGTNGHMVTGWQKIGGYWYYFEDNGLMAHDTWVGQYHLDSQGRWI